LKTYEWAVVGSGIAGVTIAEILTRQGHSVILVEKNDTLASETTREFHEWLHTGALYTLVPDRLKTLRFILGAIDDLLEFYASYDRMNLLPTVSGLKVKTDKAGWFNAEYIHFKYRVKGRKITFPWLYGIARSIFLVERIHKHDWLRRRGGELDHFKMGRSSRIRSLIKELLLSKEKFKEVKTPDFTINSRAVLKDMIATAMNNGLEVSLSNEVTRVDDREAIKILSGTKEDIRTENVAICNGTGVEKFSEVKVKTSYAPIAVVSGISKHSKSFVELDYFTKNCINLLTKENSFGLAGGISLSDKSQCDKYLDYVVNKHKELDSGIKELSRYTGVKTEITFKNQPRGYLYHIVNSDDGVWTIVPGKFTLAFSLAPEFYRRVYKQNPKKYFKTTASTNEVNNIVSNTVWRDIFNQWEKNNGSN